MKEGKILTFCYLLFTIIILTGCNNNQNNLLNNPNSNDVKEVLKTLDGVKSICVVNEDNDPNGNLNKKGSYTGAVYFRLTQVDTNLKDDEYYTPYEDDACEAGTSGGGQLEIYANEKDAKKRNDYLSNFDGSILGDFHNIRGTVIIRLSNDLTATQQQELEEQIYNALNKPLEK